MKQYRSSSVHGAMRSSLLFLVLQIIIVSLASTAAASTQKETFAEEAIVTPLSDGLVQVHLQFSQQAACWRHCTTFPKAVSQLAGAIPFQSVELSLTQGRWHYERWGAPLLQAKPAGAELRAHFAPTLAPDTLPGLWGNLSHALGGLFCASLNFVARPEATAPLTVAMQPVGDTPAQQPQELDAGQQQQGKQGHAGVRWVPGPAQQQVLYASLPQEASCTENLTPWLKLLPCRDAAGLGRLLTQRGVVFGADYHSMQVNIDVQRDQQQRPTLTTLRQSLTLVLRSPSPSAISSSTREPPKPGTLSDISLTSLLGSQAPSACPVAATSRLMLQLPQQLLLQQQEEHLSALLSIPAHSIAPPSVPEAEAESPQQQEEEGGEQRQQEESSSSNRGSRAASWSGPGFILQPAPDAAAFLAPTGPGCAGMLSAAAAGTPSGQQQDTGDISAAASGCSPLVLYVWDLHRNPTAPAAAAASAVLLRFAVQWQQQQQPGTPADASPAASPAGRVLAASGKAPQFSVARFITGTGQLHGGMTLQLTAVQQLLGAEQAAAAGGNISVCILQVVPWYVRLWLHTLRLSIDGQVKPLEDVLLPSYISPAQDRQRPLVLDLCLAVPRAAQSITLTAQFTKAFLRMLEHPPDAHRGFDVPAAVVTVGEVPGTPAEGASPDAAAAAVTSSKEWHVYAAPGSLGGEDLTAVSPLMEQLMWPQPSLVYSPGLVVPLAVPDFSMPYNVICLTSTVLAVFMGGVLNALLWRPGRDEREAADPQTAIKKKRKKMARVVVLVVSFMAVAVYYDTDLQTELLRQARSLGLYDPGPLPGDEL